MHDVLILVAEQRSTVAKQADDAYFGLVHKLANNDVDEVDPDDADQVLRAAGKSPQAADSDLSAIERYRQLQATAAKHADAKDAMDSAARASSCFREETDNYRKSRKTELVRLHGERTIDTAFINSWDAQTNATANERETVEQPRLESIANAARIEHDKCKQAIREISALLKQSPWLARPEFQTVNDESLVLA